MNNLQYVENISDNSDVFVIGDIHGNKDTLVKKMKQQKIDDDVFLIFLGDTIDRGHDSKGVLDILLTRPNTLLLMGNHESFFIDLVDYIELNGFSDDMIKESETIKNMVEIMSAQWVYDLTVDELKYYRDQIKSKFYYSALINYNGLRVGLCHAAVPNYNWNNVVNDTLQSIWSFDNYNDKNIVDVKNVDLVIHGHVPVKNIERKGNVLYIDTLSYNKNGFLTFLNLKKINK